MSQLTTTSASSIIITAPPSGSSLSTSCISCSILQLLFQITTSSSLQQQSPLFTNTFMYNTMQDINNSNGTSTNNNNNNILSSYIYLNHLDPYALSGVSIGIETLFIPLFLFMITFIGIFMTRKDVRNVMARNQKILLSLVIILLLLQSIGMIFRGIYDSLTIDIVYKIIKTVENEQGIDAASLAYSTMNSTTSAANAGVKDSQVIALYLMGSFELMTQLQNTTLILFIMLFIANVFLKTVGMATGIISTRKMTIVYYLVNVFGGSAVVLVFLVILAVSIAYFIVKIRITVDFQIYLFVATYIIFVCTVLFLGTISNIVGWAVFNVIRQRSSKLNKQANQQSLKKVVILQLGINISALIQLLSGIFVAISSELVYLKLLYYFLNNVGIVLFAMLVFGLYHPLFNGAVKELNEMKEKTSTIGNDSSRIDHAKELSADKSYGSHHSKSEKSVKSTGGGGTVHPIPQSMVNSPPHPPLHGSDHGGVEIEDVVTIV